MRLKYSKTVDKEICRLCAILATAAAKHALDSITGCEDNAGAEKWAKIAETWLRRAGAKGSGWFNQPKT